LETTATTFGFRKRTRIGTWNIRTLNNSPSKKQQQLVKEFVRLNLQIMGVCEHRLPDIGEEKISTSGSYFTFIYSGKALKINVNKTKLMRINPPRITRSSNQPIQIIIDGAVIEEVKTILIKGNICT
jgi:hypothetical protein